MTKIHFAGINLLDYWQQILLIWLKGRGNHWVSQKDIPNIRMTTNGNGISQLFCHESFFFVTGRKLIATDKNML